MDEALQQWVETVRKSGWKDDQIRHALEQKGWKENDIIELLGEQNILTNTPQGNTPGVKSRPWIVIILGSLAILGIALAVVLYLIRK